LSAGIGFGVYRVRRTKPGKFDGTWVGTDGYGETATIIISGNNYRVRGTVTYTNSTITFTQKESYSGGSGTWVSIPQQTETENYRLSGNQLTLVDGGDSITFTKQ